MANKTISYKDKFLTKDEAKEYISQGYFAVDNHCHSAFSYDVPDAKETSPEKIILTLKKAGLHPAISDHDTINAHHHLRKKGLSNGVIKAAEITIKPLKIKKVDFKGPMHTLHVNVFGLNQEQLEVLENIALVEKDLDEFIRYLRQEDLQWQYNHPFWHETGEKLNWRAVPGIAKNYFDVLEINADRPKIYNDLAIHVAEKFNKGITANSDDHTGRPGDVYTVAEGKTFDDFWMNVKAGKSKVFRKDASALELINDGYYMIKNIFKSNIKPITQKKYIPSIGIKSMDKIAKSVTSGSLKKQYLTKKAIEKALFLINFTAGPILAWKMYIHKENKHAEHIKPKVEHLVRQIHRAEKRMNAPGKKLF